MWGRQRSYHTPPPRVHHSSQQSHHQHQRHQAASQVKRPVWPYCAHLNTYTGHHATQQLATSMVSEARRQGQGVRQEGGKEKHETTLYNLRGRQRTSADDSTTHRARGGGASQRRRPHQKPRNMPQSITHRTPQTVACSQPWAAAAAAAAGAGAGAHHQQQGGLSLDAAVDRIESQAPALHMCLEAVRTHTPLSQLSPPCIPYRCLHTPHHSMPAGPLPHGMGDSTGVGGPFCTSCMRHVCLCAAHAEHMFLLASVMTDMSPPQSNRQACLRRTTPACACICSARCADLSARRAALSALSLLSEAQQQQWIHCRRRRTLQHSIHESMQLSSAHRVCSSAQLS
jgi:hypothetical protein